MLFQPTMRSLRQNSLGALNAYRRSATFASVDPREQQKFGAAAASWWDPNSTKGAGLLHALNPVRVGYIRDVVCKNIAPLPHWTPTPARPLAGLRAVDIGCGGGLLSESLGECGSLP